MEPDRLGVGRSTVPRTPRNTAGVVALWEKHGNGMPGVAGHRTGSRGLEYDSYREQRRPYI